MQMLDRRLVSFWVAAAVLLGLAVVPALAGPDQAEYDRWYVLRMQDSRAGWMHSQAKRDGDNIVSTTTMNLSIRRGAAAIELSIESAFVETADGKPVSMRNSMKLGAQPTLDQIVFKENEAEVTTTQGDKTRTVVKPLPEGVWLTPNAAAEFVRKRLEAGAEEITVRTVDPSLGLEPVVYTRKVVEKTNAEALGRVVPAVKWVSSVDRIPNVETTEFVDERGVPIRTETNMGGIKVEMILADKQLAMADVDPPELMVSTLVTPDRPIRDPRAVKQATYLLSTTAGAPPEVPETGVQTATAVDGSTVRVVVDIARPALAPEPDLADPVFLESSAMLDAEDAEVRKLVRKATRTAGEDPFGRARAMREFVHDHIDSKSLDVGFASASEVARTGAGDCSEHAALLAAMLRADKIPSRVVSGLLYVDAFAGQKDIFGYHMWTQALLETDGGKRWIDLDAVFPAGTPFDATHIALAVSTLSDDESINTMVALAPLIGNLSIKVEKTE